LTLAMSAMPASESVVRMRERVRAVGGTLRMAIENGDAIIEAFVPENREVG
jgi:hypothetical protein